MAAIAVARLVIFLGAAGLLLFVLMRDGEVVLALGAAGGRKILPAVFQIGSMLAAAGAQPCPVTDTTSPSMTG